MSHYIGLMSGTSLDGVDGVLIDWADGDVSTLRSSAHVHAPFSTPLHQELLALNAPGDNELHRAALAGNALAQAYAQVVAALLRETGLAAPEIAALGAHGQTVRHRPAEFDGLGYTVQLLNGALLAELTAIDTVCDFRSRDVAAHGQGAPLVPAFHAAAFSTPTHDVAVLNLGGIANLSLLSADGNVRGFDCGAANVLMDLWCQRHHGTAYDVDGAWAATGQVLPRLLQALLTEPFLHKAPPKSTGRDLFNAAWLDARLHRSGLVEPAPPEAWARDVMATLLEFTAQTARDALLREARVTRELLVCGGGAFNTSLMRRIAALLPSVTVASTAQRGVPPDQVEAMAFAWLASAFVQGRASNVPAVTGAAGARVLGALYPGARAGSSG